jgi:hypothetical protein
MPMIRRFSGAVSVAIALVFLASTLMASSRHSRVLIKDDCDPATFNAAVGPGTCVGDGETTFQDFIAQVTEDQSADDWEFDPDELDVARNSQVTARNVGGELHSFTPVANFGGGFIDVLNGLSGNPRPAPECAVSTPNGLAPAPTAVATFVFPGGQLTVPDKTHKFQCCIHPWMRTVVQGRDDDK